MPRRLSRADHAAGNRRAEWRAHNAGLAAKVGELRGTPEDFYALRRYELNMNRAQVARVLRVDHESIYNWETGKHRLPFPVYLALYLLHESVAYRFSDEAWRDWRITQRFDAASRNWGDVSELTNAKIGAAFTPVQLEYVHLAMQALAMLDAEAHKLRGELAAATDENEQLRQMVNAAGLSDELHELRQRLDGLFRKFNTAEVRQLRPAKWAAA